MIKIANVYRADNGDVFVKLEQDYIRDYINRDELIAEAQSMEPTPCKAVEVASPVQALIYRTMDDEFILDSAFITKEFWPSSCASGFYLHKEHKNKTTSERLAALAVAEARKRREKRRGMDREILESPTIVPNDLIDNDETNN